MADTASVVTRIAPSPTGRLHIGIARSALFNFLFARKHHGVFILRIEDTDTERSKKEYEEDILESLTWLGLMHDELYRQSERTAIYRTHLEKLIESDRAYASQEPSKTDPNQTTEVVRLRNPGSTVTFADQIRGNVTFDTKELGDFVIARSLDEPLYHLAVVIDDHDMHVSHVIRGEDHISNTPRQILIQEALDFQRPQYVHIPLILAPDRSKLSKRHGASSVSDFREQGYLPEALVNYMALLGWSPDNDRELFSLEELVQIFDLEGIQQGGAVFDEQKLKWFNREYLKKIPAEELFETVKQHLPQHILKLPGYNDEVLRRAMPLMVERIATLGEIEGLAESGEIAYYFASPEIEANALCWRDASKNDTKKHLGALPKLLESVSEEEFSAECIREVIWPYAEREGRGVVLWPMRFALSGQKQSPDPFSLAAVIGKTETLKRLSYAQSLFTT